MKKNCLTFLLAGFAFVGVYGQSRSVTGTVLDVNGDVIIGAAVKIAGTTQGTITDVDGSFMLNVDKGQTLEISYVGYTTQSVKVANSDKIAVTLYEDQKLMDEVIVTGYGSVSKKNLTTAIAKIDPDEVVKAGNSNMSQMLMGRAAGLKATLRSAQPGGGVDISIRGGSTPIYVVDGVVIPGSSLEGASGGSTTVMPASVNRSGMAGINPEDIESIEVLKDASAAIYGIGAADGVVLITTKKGKSGNVKVTYDGSVSYVSNYKYLEMLDAQGYERYVNIFSRERYLLNNGMGIYGGAAFDGNWIAPYTDAAIASAQTTDWQGHVLKDGSINQHNITVQGGTDKLNYYLSGNFFAQDGTVRNSDFTRYTLHSNVQAQLFSFMKLTTAINLNSNKNHNGTVGGSSNGRGSQASGALAAAMAYPTNMSVYDEQGNLNTFGTIPNAFGMDKMEDVSRSTGWNVNFTLDFDIWKKHLTAKLLYGYNNEHAQRSVYIPSDVWFDQTYQSRGSLVRDERYGSTLEGTLNFNYSWFDDNIIFDAVAGMGRYTNKYTGMNVSYYDGNDVIGNDNISTAAGNVAPGSYHAEDEKRSQFARASLDLLDRYVIAGTMRRDGTDKFFDNKKYNWFPSVSLAWKVMNEKFMEIVDWINLLKLRASYGMTGSDNLGASLYGSFTAYGSYVMFDQNSTKYVPYYLASQDYPDVTWQKTKMLNFGVDFSVFRDRLSGSFDLFRNDITNMLGTANSSGLDMFSTYPINGAHERRTGWDLTLNTTNVKNNNFVWTSVLTLSHYKDYWVERMPNYDYLDYQLKEDEPVNALYLYRTDGIINADKSNMPSHQPAGWQLPGMPIIRDLNGDGQITVDDVECNDVNPSIYWGFGNDFRFKHWDLSVFIYSQMGLKKYNYAYSWTSSSELAAGAGNQSVLMDKVWTSDNQSGTIPGIAYSLNSSASPLPGGAGDDTGYEDADFIRVRNITLGYNWDRSNLGRLGKTISQIRVYADVQNPFTFTSFESYDPEVYSGGNYKAGKAEYPMTRTFSLGVKLAF